MQIDVHTHLLPAPVAAAVGQAPYDAPGDADERIVVSLDGLLGIEALPRAEAEPLLDAYHEAAFALPEPTATWAHVPLAEPDAADVHALLDRGALGLHLPAAALADPDGVARCGPLLAACAERAAPVLVHPGPAPWRPRRLPTGAPAWWTDVVGDVADLHAAWWSIRGLVRPAFPTLRVCVASLAGLAPLHGDRYARSSGRSTLIDPLVFVDTSGYGQRALDAMIRVLGVDVVVHGTDRPHPAPADALPSGALAQAIRSHNPARLLFPQEVTA